MANAEKCFIRACVMGVLPSGRKRIQLWATGADGISFYTDDESLIPADDFTVVVHARWVETKNGFHCSNCKEAPGLHPTKRGVFLSDHCPNCGAKMDLKEE